MYNGPNKVDGPGDGYVATGSGGADTNYQSCFRLVDPPINDCDTRIVAALDKTYQSRGANAIGNIKAVLTGVADFTEGGTIGIANLRSSDVTWSVALDSDTATDMDLFKTRVAGIKQVQRSSRTRFGTLFSTVANKVYGNGDVPSFLFLMSDFKLKSMKHYNAIAKDVHRMKNRLGPDAPQLICYLSVVEFNNNNELVKPKFFAELCDEQWWSGKDGATDAGIAESIGDTLCDA